MTLVNVNFLQNIIGFGYFKVKNNTRKKFASNRFYLKLFYKENFHFKKKYNNNKKKKKFKKKKSFVMYTKPAKGKRFCKNKIQIK